MALPLKHYLVSTDRATILCFCRFQLEFMTHASRPVRYFVQRPDVTMLAETMCSSAVPSSQKEYDWYPVVCMLLCA